MTVDRRQHVPDAETTARLRAAGWRPYGWTRCERCRVEVYAYEQAGGPRLCVGCVDEKAAAHPEPEVPR